MATHPEFRPVIVCGHKRPLIVDSRRQSCENTKGHREPLDQIHTSAEAARDAGYDHIEYRWTYNHAEHYVTTDERTVTDWAEES